MMRDPEYQKYDKYVPVGKDFRNELMRIIHNAEESNEEIASILKEVAASLESTI
jgi:hypothetical protein